MQFPRSWYPLCCSHEVKRGAVISVQALGQQLAVFRTVLGKPAAVKAQCCHIGADLSNGWVTGERLICPLHMWAFDTQGQCQDIPCQQEIPKRVRQNALPCVERYGLIYGFFGDSIDFNLPGYSETGQFITSSPLIIDFAAPYEMAGANSFDEQHLATVHRRQVINGQKIMSDSSEHFAIEYQAKVCGHTLYDKILHLIGKKQVHMRLDCRGGNLLFFSHLGTSNRMIISLLPIDDQHSRAFISTLLPQAKNKLFWPLQYMAALILNRFTMMFVQQDVKALQGINFKFINVLAEADATMIKWYQYWKQLPRYEFSCSSKK